MKHFYQYFYRVCLFFDYRLYLYPLLFTYCTGYDVYNSVIRWHPASVEDPAYVRDPASIRSFTVLTP